MTPVNAATVMGYLPRGNLLDDRAWRRRHTVVQTLLLLHVPALAAFGWWQGFPPLTCLYVVVTPVLCYAAAAVIKRRRVASFFTTVGVVYCSAALVGLSRGSIEAHFHFFIIIGFIALYQDWVPFLWNIAFTVLSHGLGSLWQSNLIFNHPSAQAQPWVWSGIHGVAVLFACVGMVIFWRTSEDEQQKALALTKQLSDAELARREFTSDLLVNLARRNQSLLYRQLDIINQLEESERDPDVLSWLFQLDHLATRVRRNAESLLVLSGEDPPRVWSKPVRLIEVVRAAIAETEDLSRVAFMVDDRPAVLGQIVADLTHLIAELTENAVRFSPPETRVTIRSAPDPMSPGTCVVTVEDWGVGMRPEDLVAANERLTDPQEVDLATSRQLGLHVVARLATRHGIKVTLVATQGAGLTAIVVLPPDVFARPARHSAGADGRPALVRAESARDFSPPMASASMVASPRAIPATAERAWPDSWAEPQVDVIDIRQEPAREHRGWAEPVAAEPVRVDAEWVDETWAEPYQPHPPGSTGRPQPAYLQPTGQAGYAPPNGPVDGYPGNGYPGNSSTSAFPDQPAARRRGYRPQPPTGPGATAEPAEPMPVPGEAGRPLARRTPQAHLAPELRRGATREPVTLPMPDAARTRDALSRYQASRQAALRRSGHQDPEGGRSR
jgi:signal transduction histidine kinase